MMATRGHLCGLHHRPGLVLSGFIIGLALILSGCGTSGTTTWQGIGPNARSITALATEPGQMLTIFAGSAGQGLFRSLDGGESWAADNTGLPSSATVNSIVIDQTQSGLIYLGTDQGVFLSNDNGDHWQSASRGLPAGAGDAVTTLLLNPDDATTIYAGTAQNGVYISHDGAKSWSASAQGLPAGATVHALLAEESGQTLLLYAAIAGAGVYQSKDGGANWSTSNTGLPVGVDGLSLLSQPSDPGGLYVGTSMGVYRSTDGGASWKAANTGLGQTPPQVVALGLNTQQPTFLYAATSTGVFLSTDGGANWGQLVSGLPNHSVAALAVVGSPSNAGTLYAAAGQIYVYPTVTGAAGGQIVTFVILGIFLLLFLLLFRQQRRVLQKMTPHSPTRLVRPSRAIQQSNAEAAGTKNGATSVSSSGSDLAAPEAEREPDAGHALGNDEC